MDSSYANQSHLDYDLICEVIFECDLEIEMQKQILWVIFFLQIVFLQIVVEICASKKPAQQQRFYEEV